MPEDKKKNPQLISLTLPFTYH